MGKKWGMFCLDRRLPYGNQNHFCEICLYVNFPSDESLYALLQQLFFFHFIHSATAVYQVVKLQYDR